MKVAPLRICLDARLSATTSGGVGQVIIGLASALSKLADGDEEYFFLTFQDGDAWLRPYVHGPCRILAGPPERLSRTKCWLSAYAPRLRAIHHKIKCLAGEKFIKLQKSDGTIERTKVDVMHFTKQGAFLTDVPSIYQPHDLQHLHLPQFHTPWQRMEREFTYRTFCKQARMVVAMSSWGKRDLIRQYALPADKVYVIPWAPVTTAYAVAVDSDLVDIRKKFNLPEAFAFYPALTWPHKNHLNLLSALAILRDKHDLAVPLVCSGETRHFFSQIKKHIQALGLTNQVQFLGFVSSLELKCLYRLSRCLIFPSKFEGFGMPVTEAFEAGVPAACSNVTCLPELAGHAALLFDPDRPDEIAEAVRQLWTDATLRATLAERGRKNVSRFTWEHTARTFRAHYRRLASRPLRQGDRDLLESPPLL
jgi:glycosyltransferase involved in cell wall biosynthesis